MAYFNDSFTSHFTSVAFEELELYPSLHCQALATTEEVYREATPTFADGLTSVDQPGPSTVVPTSLHETTGYGK